MNHRIETPAGSNSTRPNIQRTIQGDAIYAGIAKLLKFLDEVENVVANFIGLFLVDKMGNSFHYNHLFQKRHIFLEPTTVYEILGA